MIDYNVDNNKTAVGTDTIYNTRLSNFLVNNTKSVHNTFVSCK